LATTVYNVEEIQLQNGQTAKLKPLSIKELRKFMVAIQKTSNVTTEDETLPTMNRILEVCGGIKLDDPNLLAAAVLAGQNSI
jgi:hypothetical protein